MSALLSWQQYDSQHGLSEILTDGARACVEARAPSVEVFLAAFFARRTSTDVVQQAQCEWVIGELAGARSLRVRMTLYNRVEASAVVALTPDQVATASRMSSAATDKCASAAAGVASTALDQRISGTNAMSKAFTALHDVVLPSLQGKRIVGTQGELDADLERFITAAVDPLASGSPMRGHHLSKSSKSMSRGDGDCSERMGSCKTVADTAAPLPALSRSVALAVSVCIARLAASSQEQPLFQVLAHLFRGRPPVPGSCFLPQPIVTLCGPAELSQAATNIGKLCVRDICIVPKEDGHCSMAKVDMMDRVAAALRDRLQSGVRQTDGALQCESMDNLTELVELCRGAVVDAGLIPLEDCTIGFAFDPLSTYNPATGKYSLFFQDTEVTGAQLSEYLATQVKESQGFVSYLEDTHHPSDIASMQRLMAHVGADVVLCGRRINALVDANGEPGSGAELRCREMCTNHVCLQPNDSGTVSTLFTVARALDMFRESGQTLSVASELVDTDNAWLADLSVALGARFLRCNGIHHRTTADLLSRLLQLQREVEERRLDGDVPELKAVQLPPLTDEVVPEIKRKADRKKKKR